MPQPKRNRRLSQATRRGKPQRLRIIGGKHRGRPILWSGDPVTRPMKDDVREAVFNLVGGWVPGRAAFDLFAGTGAVGLEAISRGATRAWLVERHFPTVRLIRENVQNIAPDANIEIAAEDSFFWSRTFLAQPELWPAEPWVVFCCPPYDLFVEREVDMVKLVQDWFAAAPSDSLFVVESDPRFDPGKLPSPGHWMTRTYPPAQVSVYRESKGANAYPPPD